jgi:HlyD family secretion protein
VNIDDAGSLRRSTRAHIVVGGASAILLLAGVGGWAGSTELASAVIASGVVTVEGNIKNVQHPSGGVVAELLAREGQNVEVGEVLVRLDATTPRANLAVITKTFNQLLARQARLEAERDGGAEVPVPPELTQRLGQAEVEEQMSTELRLFESRRLSRDGQKGQLHERAAQLGEQIRGHTAQQEAKTEEIDLIDKELVGVRWLFQQGLTPIDRVNTLARAAARLRGERGQLIAAVAEARGRISETSLQLLQIDQTLRSEVAAELRDVQVRQGELAEREVAAAEQLRRIEVRAPIAGLVHQLAVHTVGGVVSPAEALMKIVPRGSELVIEARISAPDIDQIEIGQTAILRFTAFNRNTTPELVGTVTRVSGDAVPDERSGVSYYKAGIAVAADELAKLNRLTLVPGMQVDCFVQQGRRTVISYLAKPLADHASRVFRER